MIKIITITKQLVSEILPKRKPNSHKGTYGTVLNVTGSYGFAGACALSALASYKTGVGLVKCAVPKNIYNIVAPFVPEAIFSPYRIFKKSFLENSDSCVVGCGCKNSKKTERLVKKILKYYKKPLVIDADGINVLQKNIRIVSKAKCSVVLTPHPKEASRVLGVSVAEIQKNREKYARILAEKTNATVLLKGANTLVTDGKECFVLPVDNSALATAGSGDVLAGVIGGLLSLGLDAVNSAVCGAYLHAVSGEKAADTLGEASVTARDILEHLAFAIKDTVS